MLGKLFICVLAFMFFFDTADSSQGMVGVFARTFRKETWLREDTHKKVF